MNKKLLLILLLPMALIGMSEPIDPSTLHDPCEDSMTWQAASLAKERAKKNLDALASGSAAVFYAVKGTYAAMFALKTAAVKAVVAKAILTGTQVNPAMVAAAAGKITALSSLSAVSAATGAIGAGGALVLALQTYDWAGDVKKAYDKKQEFLEEKRKAIETYDAYQKAKNEKGSGDFPLSLFGF